MKTNITLTEAIEGVKELFEVTSFNNKQEGKSFYIPKDDGSVTFFFDKRQHWRQDVIEKLSFYFQDKYITDGQCRIDNLTLVWTTVHLEHLDIIKKTPEEEKKEYCDKLEKYRDEEFTRKNGTKIKLKDIPDEEVKAIVRKELGVSNITMYRIFQGELLYRIDKGIYTLSSNHSTTQDQ